MDKYEKLQEEIQAKKDADYKALILDVKKISNCIEKLISMALNSSSAKMERDLHIQSF